MTTIAPNPAPRPVTAPAPADTPPQVRLGGRYRLESELPDGVFGPRWSAVDERLWLRVEVETATRDPEGMVAYAKTLSRFSHANVLKVRDVGQEQVTPYVVRDRSYGTPLRHLIDGGSITPRDARHIVAQASAGLAAAHEAGVSHPGLTADDILVDRNGAVTVTGWERGPWDRSVLDDVADLGQIMREMLQGAPLAETPAWIESLLEQMTAEEPMRRPSMIAVRDQLREPEAPTMVLSSATAVLPVAPTPVDVAPPPPSSTVDRWLVGAFIGLFCLGVLGLILWALPIGDEPVREARVPDVQGVTLQEARERLARSGFLDRVLASNEATDQTVRATDPQPGDLAPEGSEVSLALGDPPITSSEVAASSDEVTDACPTDRPDNGRHTGQVKKDPDC